MKESKASGERTLQTMEKLYKDSISELRAQMSTKAAEYEQTIASLQFESDDRRKRILQQSNLLDLQRRLYEPKDSESYQAALTRTRQIQGLLVWSPWVCLARVSVSSL
jgi:vacuolar-type H+-ATPase subunit I/STV1